MNMHRKKFTLIFTLLISFICSDLLASSRNSHSPLSTRPSGLNQTPPARVGSDDDGVVELVRRPQFGELVIPPFEPFNFRQLPAPGPVAVRLPTDQFAAETMAILDRVNTEGNALITQEEAVLANRHRALEAFTRGFTQSLAVTHANLQEIINNYATIRRNYQAKYDLLYDQAEGFMRAHQNDQIRIRSLQDAQQNFLALIDRYGRALTNVEQATNADAIRRCCADANRLKTALEQASTRVADIMRTEATTSGDGAPF